MSPAEFCEKHKACESGRAWAIGTGCATMAEMWERDDLRMDWRVWIFSRAASDREIRLFACFCARRVAHLNPDPRVVAAIDVAERYARGDADDKELAAAGDAALDAEAAAWAAAGAAASCADRGASDAARAAARSAARDATFAARDAARDAAFAAARDATFAARDAAWAAAGAAAWAAFAAARAAEERAQCEYLRGLPNPFAEATHA